ncbi:hypothetical protein CR513_37955, partial [Mucuna pruriens]
MDMVRSMRSNAKLPQFLWIEAIKMITCALNRVLTKVVLKTPFELLEGWKPSLRHICIRDAPLNGYFIGYIEKSKGYRFYYPTHNTRIMESRIAKFFENDLTSRSDQFQDIVNEKDHYEAQLSDSNYVEKQLVKQHVLQQDNEAALRKSTRVKKLAIPSDYVAYLQESDYNIGAKNDPKTFSQAMSSKESNLWYNAMKYFPNGVKSVGCIWVLKIKKDLQGNIERHKVRLVVKRFTQREEIDYTETFSPVSKKDYV